MSEDIINVWNEVRFTSDGISITLFSESQDGGAIVEDELWYTYDEMQELSPSRPISLNLSDETQSAIAGQLLSDSQQSAQSEISEKSQKTIVEDSQSEIAQEEQVDNLPKVGHIVIDGNPPDWATDRELEVVGISDKSADEYVVEERYGNRDDLTVADANPNCDPDETVVEAKYLDSGGLKSEKTYAFPASRLITE